MRHVFTFKPTKKWPWPKDWETNSYEVAYQDGIWSVRYFGWDAGEAWRKRKDAPRVVKHVRDPESRRAYNADIVKERNLQRVDIWRDCDGECLLKVGVIGADAYRVFYFSGVTRIVDDVKGGGALAVYLKNERGNERFFVSPPGDEWARRFVKPAGCDYIDNIESNLFIVLAGSKYEKDSSRCLHLTQHMMY